MSKPKLFYFDAPVSRGEECRLAFAVAGIDFEDVRLSREQWAAMKPSSPFGSLPILEVAGKPPLAQSNAILGWIGSQSSLLPKDAFDAARHVSVMDSVEELRHKLAPTLFLEDPEAKKKAREELAATTIPQWGARIEKLLGDGPFFGGKDISVADVKLFVVTRWLIGGKLDHIPTTVLDACPKLKKLHDAVADHPGVKAWHAKAS
jgi:glutathione S-transferase